MISPHFHPFLGGAERQAFELAKALASRGTRVTVLTRSGQGLPACENIEGFEIRRLGSIHAFPSVGFMIAVFAWLWNHAPEWDVVHSHLAGSHALPAALAAKILLRPAFVKIGGGRGIGEVAASRGLGGRAKWWLLKRLRPRLVAVSSDLAAELAEHGVDLPVAVIPNGVDTERFRPAGGEKKAALRKANSSQERDLEFVYAGRFAPEKRLREFIAAFAGALESTQASARLALAGEGTEERMLKETAENLGLLEKSVYFRGRMEHLERDFYPSADVFVLPSVSEGLSNALLEAMSCGLAVLASRVGGNVEAVEDGRSGILFDPGDPEAMKRAIERFLRHPELAEVMGARARETALRRYDLRQVAERYLSLYQGNP